MSDNRDLSHHPRSKGGKAKRFDEPLAEAPLDVDFDVVPDPDVAPSEQSEALESFEAADAPVAIEFAEQESVEQSQYESASEETAMNDHAHDGKRDAGSPEDQSKQAAHEAKHAALQAQKAADAAAIAKAELAKRKAASAHAAAILDAEHNRDQSRAEKERFAQQLESASKVSRHLHNVLNEANMKSQASTDHYGKLKITLDQAEADMKAAAAEAALKADEYGAAQKIEADLRAKVTDLDTADETYEMAKATAEVVLAGAKSDYAQEIARIKKAAADRDMTSFGA